MPCQTPALRWRDVDQIKIAGCSIGQARQAQKVARWQPIPPLDASEDFQADRSAWDLLTAPPTDQRTAIDTVGLSWRAIIPRSTKRSSLSSADAVAKCQTRLEELPLRKMRERYEPNFPKSEPSDEAPGI